MGIEVFFWLIPGLFWQMDLAFSESIWLSLRADLDYIATSDLDTLRKTSRIQFLRKYFRSSTLRSSEVRPVFDVNIEKGKRAGTGSRVKSFIEVGSSLLFCLKIVACDI
jgi:hypothetical protein